MAAARRQPYSKVAENGQGDYELEGGGEGVELRCQLRGQLGTELGVVILDLGDRCLPAIGIN